MASNLYQDFASLIATKHFVYECTHHWQVFCYRLHPTKM